MYIKNQTFKDEDTLLELLFDFSLGNQSEIIKKIISGIETELETNQAYTDYYNSLKDEDERIELHAEESRLRLAEKLMDIFDSFQVKDSKLFGIKNGKPDLLYEIDLY